jgi:hypothetical protein
MKDQYVRFLTPERFPGFSQVPLSVFADRFKIGAFRFVPLVCEAFATCCRLDIVYLRPQPHGPLINQYGDIDNRIKTLFDAFRLPQPGPEIEELTHETVGQDEDPFFCLLEDDSLITGFSVTADRLLARKAPVANWPEKQTGHPENEVHLVVTVEVKLARYAEINLPFA